MSDHNSSVTQQEDVKNVVSPDNGKGKATATETNQEVSMDEDSSDDEKLEPGAPVADEEDPDSMEEIDLNNIVPGRTRRRQIDFVKAAQEHSGDDEDEEDDEDFMEDEDEKMNED